MIFQSTVKNPKKTHYLGEDHDENIEYIFRRSPWVLIPSILFLLIMIIFPLFFIGQLSKVTILEQQLFTSSFITTFVVFWYFFSFALFFHNLIIWYYNVYLITNKKILDVDFEGLLYKNISEATLEHIEDVTSEVKGFFSTILDIGTVYIQTAGESPQFEFNNVENPSKIRDIISDLVANRRRHGGRHKSGSN